MYKEKVLLRRIVTPHDKKLTDWWSFLVRYERVSRKNLLSNVAIRTNQTIGPRRQRKCKTRQGTGLLGSVFSLGNNLISSGALAKGSNIASRAINSDIEEKVIDEQIKHGPELYKIGTKKIKNKSLKKTFELQIPADIANYALKQAQENLFNWQNV